MAKKLTANSIKNLDKALNIKKTVNIKNEVNGDEYEVIVTTHLRKSAIEDVVMEYIEYLQEMNSRVIVNDKLIKDSMKLIDTLTLKRFTNLPIPNEISLEELISLTKTFGDIGLTEQIIKQIPQAELDKIAVYLKEVSEKAANLVVDSTSKNIINN